MVMVLPAKPMKLLAALVLAHEAAGLHLGTTSCSPSRRCRGLLAAAAAEPVRLWNTGV
jgi:hypothetical protein